MLFKKNSIKIYQLVFYKKKKWFVLNKKSLFTFWYYLEIKKFAEILSMGKHPMATLRNGARIWNKYFKILWKVLELMAPLWHRS